MHLNNPSFVITKSHLRNNKLFLIFNLATFVVLSSFYFPCLNWKCHIFVTIKASGRGGRKHKNKYFNVKTKNADFFVWCDSPTLTPSGRYANQIKETSNVQNVAHMA